MPWCVVMLVGVIGQSACREFCGVQSRQNGTRWYENIVVPNPSSLVGF